jgi:hypothetical protein
MTLHEAVLGHASLLCERELAHTDRTRAVHDAARVVTFAVAEWLAGPATADATVRRALEAIYLEDSPAAVPLS